MRDDVSQKTRLDAIGDICEEFHIDSLAPQVAAASETLRSGGVVDIAVLGQFKAGKSSFLNCLIGREAMPVDVLPATAVVTRIGFGPADRAVVHRMGGGDEEIPVDRLAEFVTEKRNPGNEKKVSIVEVSLSSLAEFPGVRFVDTPGLGSIFAHNTLTSLEWLPRVGGALLAVSVNHPFSGQDRKLLEEIFRNTPEAAILLTKADLVSESQLDAVVEFTRRQAAYHTGREIPILPYSVMPGYETFRDLAREYLLRRVVERREEKFDEIVNHKIRSLAAGCRAYLRLSLAAAAADEQARSDLKEVLMREHHDLGAVRSEMSLFSRDMKSRVRTAAGERFHSYQSNVSGRLSSALPERMEGWKGNLAKTTREFQGWLAATLEEELTGISAAEGEQLSGFLFKARSSIARTVRAFQDRLAKEIERALGLSFEGANFHAEVEEPSRPDIRTGRTFDTGVELLWFLIPMGIFRPLVRRHFLRRIPWEVEKNLSRLAAQWADAVNASIDGLARQSMAFLANELATLEGLVGNASDRRPEIQKALDLLDSLEAGAAFH
ncbi:MAG: dynamin [Deltaproteobacteria bacterium CSP1-8]|nr:MAG: dynamin [Deltaproteobacteria bacterium CSP1-8]